MQLLLSQYSSSKDVAVLTAMAGRPAVEVEPLVGWFACGCAIRTNLEGVPPPASAWPARPEVAKRPTPPTPGSSRSRGSPVLCMQWQRYDLLLSGGTIGCST